MNRTKLALALAALLIPAAALSGKKDAAPPPPPAPELSPEVQAQVGYRHVLMESMGKHMKLATLIAKKKVDRPGDAVMHARALHDAAGPMPALFPDRSGHPAIDKNREGFNAAVDAYEKATMRLVKSAESGDMADFADTLAEVGPTCGACHDGYRAEDDD